MISWLNQNAGATTAILTAAYVITTIIITIFNYKTIREMQLSREQLIKPQIVISFETRRKGLLCIVLRNLGGSVATNLNISLSESFIDCLPRDKERFKNFNNLSITIVPKQEIIFPCGGPQDFSSISKTTLSGTITYIDTFNREYNELFSIDTKSYGGALLCGPEIDELTATIDKGLDNIKKEIKNFKG